jgi:hypothetical protein
MSTQGACRQVAGQATAWRNITVRFGDYPRPACDLASGPALRMVEFELHQMHADEQVVSVVRPGWATWTFLPGVNLPADLIRLVRAILTDYDPGGWVVQADD